MEDTIDLEVRKFEKENFDPRPGGKGKGKDVDATKSTNTAPKAILGHLVTSHAQLENRTSALGPVECKIIDETVVKDKSEKDKKNRDDSEPITCWLETAIDNAVNGVVAAVDDDFVQEVLEIASEASTFVLKSVSNAIQNLDEALNGYLEDESYEFDDEESETEDSHKRSNKHDKGKDVNKESSTKTGKGKRFRMTSLVKLRRMISGGAKQYSA